MFIKLRTVSAAVGLTVLTIMTSAQAQNQIGKSTVASTPALQALVDKAVTRTLAAFADKNLGSNELAVTLIDLRQPEHPRQAAYRGEEQIYPASVVKLFYLAAAHRQMEDGKLQDTAELRRAMHE
jgi:beta-lactamase class A